MLEVQRALRAGETLDGLKARLGIRAVIHEELPLVILNYDQVESPKGDPAVRECRGLVLETGTWDLIARSFPRFFNWGEMAEEMPLFDFGAFFTQEKVDGSLVLLYCYRGVWMVNTRGSFGAGRMEWGGLTWRQGVVRALDVDSLDDLGLDPGLTYACEFVSPYNKVVRRYESFSLYLLTAFRGEAELRQDELPLPWGFSRPMRYSFGSVEEIKGFLEQWAKYDPTYEGVVICDKGFRRWKLKSPAYLALHRLRGDGNLYHPRHLLPYVLANDGDELLTYFPEARPAFLFYQGRVRELRDGLERLWEAARGEASQKEFALKVKDHPLSSVLFAARKAGREASEVFGESGDLILKHLPAYEGGETDGTVYV